jgi:hypothetical protein
MWHLSRTALHPFVPAEAGTQGHVQHTLGFAALGPRLRGDERISVLIS